MIFCAQISLAMILRPATVDPVKPVALTVSLAWALASNCRCVGGSECVKGKQEAQEARLTSASYLLRDCFLFSNP